MSRTYSAYVAQVALLVKRQRRRRDPLEIQMEYMPEWEQCRAVSPPPKEDYCILRYGHEGPCCWRSKA